MPEVESQISRRREQAATAVGEWVSTLPSARQLNRDELRAAAGEPSHGWRLDVAFSGGSRQLDLLLTDGFPRKPPRVVLVDRPKFLSWPHVDEDGSLCLLPDNAEIDFTRPVDVTKTVLASAAELVEDLVATGRPEDFRAEFNTYWERSAGRRKRRVYSLLAPVPPSGLMRVWKGQEFFLIGEEDVLASWLTNRFPKGGNTATEAAAVIWLPHPLVPSEFPNTPAQVFALAETHGGAPLLDQLIFREHGDVVVFAVPTVNGPCFAATTLIAKQHSGQSAPSVDGPVRGFRPRKAPKRLLVSRIYGGGSAMKSVVERADAPWVHGRGQDRRFEKLRGSTVAVIGCGSIGAPVVLQLAGAGVGGLILIDSDTLKWANVGRHPLGATGVGRSKAEALAELIRSNYPHIRLVEDVDAKWPHVGEEITKKLVGCDLIVSAIGDWATEASLNEWHRVERQGPIVYGWTEAHACAGHAVASLQPNGCLQCGFSADGTPRVRVTDWPMGSTVKQEPACGAVYQPYGPIELGHIVSVIAETAIDCLLGTIKTSVCRTWVGSRSLLESAGGSWNSDWLARAGGREEGGFILNWEWPRLPTCVECGLGEK